LILFQALYLPDICVDFWANSIRRNSVCRSSAGKTLESNPYALVWRLFYVTLLPVSIDVNMNWGEQLNLKDSEAFFYFFRILEYDFSWGNLETLCQPPILFYVYGIYGNDKR